MYEEINRFVILLGESVSSYLEDIVDTKCEYIPLALAFVAKACYVKYDTKEEKITKIMLIMVEKDGVIIEVDPISRQIRSYIAGQVCGSLQMKEHVADAIGSCIRVCWNKRLSMECLLSMDGDGRYITANLFAQ